MARTPIDAPKELRARIQKCNNTISGLMREMAGYHGTPHFIDWSDLIGRLKNYRSELEQELKAKNSSGAVAVAPPKETPAPDPDDYMGTGDSDDDEIAY